MRRETLKQLADIVASGPERVNERTAADALATDAEVKRLKREAKVKDEALRAAIAEFDRRGLSPWEARAKCIAALKPARRTRIGHLCVTTSGDEQVLCDDPKCPRNHRRSRK